MAEAETVGTEADKVASTLESAATKLTTPEDLFAPSDDEAEKDGSHEEGEEEENKEDDEELPPGAPEGKLPSWEPEAETSQEDQGKEFKVEGVHIYEVGIRNNEVGIIIIPDVWGWRCGRTRALADYAATRLNADAVIPRLLDKPPYNDGPQEDGLPEDFPLKEKGLQSIKGWLMKHTYEFYLVRVKTAANFLRQKGVKKFGVIGLGWGCWLACYCAEFLGAEFKCGVLHSSIAHILCQWDDIKPTKLLGKLNGPMLFISSGDDAPEYGEGGEYLVQNQEKFFQDTEWEVFKDMESGFAIHGDMSNPRIREHILTTFFVTTKFLRKFLWPFPLGAGYGYLRLMSAEGDTENMTILLKAGVPAGGRDSRDEVGQTPVFYAAREGFGGACRLLVEYEADVNEIGGVGGETALHVAAQNNKHKCIRMLIAVRADPEIVDRGGQRPLHRACRLGAMHGVKALMENRAELEARDTCEQTSLHMGCFFGHEDVVRYLLLQRADIYAEDIRGQTPKKIVVKHGFEAISLMVDKDIEKRETEAWHAEQEAAAAEKEALMQEMANSSAGKKMMDAISGSGAAKKT